MKQFIFRAWSDIKQRKSIELYVMLLLSIVILTADIFGVASEPALQGILLATLAALIYGLIESRHMNEETTASLRSMQNAITPSASLKRWDRSETAAAFSHASTVSFLNVSNYTWVGTNQATLRTLLQKGGNIRCILVKPDSDAFHMVLERDPQGTSDAESLRMDIAFSEKLIYQIGKEADNEKGVEVRHIRSLAPLVMTMIDERLESGVIFCSFNGFKQEYAERPSVTLHKGKDSEWFSFYQATFENYWNYAEKKSTAADR